MSESLAARLMTLSMNRRRFTILAGVGTMSLLAACDDDGDDDDVAADPDPDDDEEDMVDEPDDDEVEEPDDDDEEVDEPDEEEPDDEEDDDAAEPVEGVELIIGANNEPNTMDPHYSIGRHTEVFHVNIFDSLVKRDIENEIIPGLAESWEQLDDTTWEFHLREGVTFHNGDDFTAEDVEFTINRVIDPETEATIVGQFSTVEGAEAVDDYTVHVTTFEPDIMILSRLSELYGSILPKNHLEDVGTEVFSEDPVGTGAYRMVEWAIDERIVLERNEDYWGGAPEVERVTVRTILDDSTRISSLQAGEVDMINAVPFIRIDEIENDPDLKVATAPSPRVFHVHIDPREAPFDDVRVRQALNYAVDVDAIVESVLRGYGRPLATFVDSASTCFDPSIEPYGYDPDRARELLEEAGYPDGFDTRFYSFTGSIADHNTPAEAVVDYLRAVGINVEMEVMEFGALGPLRLDDQLGPLWIYSFGNWAAEEPYLVDWYMQQGASAHYTNDEIYALSDEMSQTFDVEERCRLSSEMQQILKDDAGFIFLHQGEQVFAMREGVDYDPRPDEMFELSSLSVSS
jgi:peptide/nickel transport system substrate-binding protein